MCADSFIHPSRVCNIVSPTAFYSIIKYSSVKTENNFFPLVTVKILAEFLQKC